MRLAVLLPSLTVPRLAMVDPVKLYVVPVATVPDDIVVASIWPAAIDSARLDAAIAH